MTDAPCHHRCDQCSLTLAAHAGVRRCSHRRQCAQQSFKTPEEAADALVDRGQGRRPQGVLTVLGPGGADIVSSGDAVADAVGRASASSRPTTPSIRW